MHARTGVLTGSGLLQLSDLPLRAPRGDYLVQVQAQLLVLLCELVKRGAGAPADWCPLGTATSRSKALAACMLGHWISAGSESGGGRCAAAMLCSNTGRPCG